MKAKIISISEKKFAITSMILSLSFSYLTSYIISKILIDLTSKDTQLKVIDLTNWLFPVFFILFVLFSLLLILIIKAICKKEHYEIT